MLHSLCIGPAGRPSRGLPEAGILGRSTCGSLDIVVAALARGLCTFGMGVSCVAALGEGFVWAHLRIDQGWVPVLVMSRGLLCFLR